MDQIKVPLGNGYSLVAVNDTDPLFPREIHVGILDQEDVWHQDLVRVMNEYHFENDNEVVYHDGKFSIQVFADANNEDFTDDFSVGLYHYDDEGEAEQEEQEDAETLSDTKPDDEPDDTATVLTYGDKGESVKAIQRRLKELGYFNGTIGGNYLTRTKAAVQAFQTEAGLHVDGVCDAATYAKLFSGDAPSVEKAESTTEETHGKAIEMDWWKSDIQKIFAKGVTATITDVDTGLTWKEQRRGGTNHADVQPISAADTAALKKAYGGKWSWNRRAIWVTINGVNYAASMNGMPHGGSSIKDNNFDGHHCIHFTNSRTHCSNKVCPNHQKMIQKALKASL